MNIKQLRQKRRISQRELAEKAGVTQMTINSLENNKVTNAQAKTRGKIEQVLMYQKQHPIGNRVPDSLLARMDRVREILNSWDTESEVFFLEELTDDAVIYSVVAQGGKQHYRVLYSINDDSSVAMNEDTKTRVQVTWTPVSEGGPQNQSRGHRETLESGIKDPHNSRE